MRITLEDRLRSAPGTVRVPLVEFNHCNAGYKTLYIIFWGNDGHVRHWIAGGSPSFKSPHKPIVVLDNVIMWKENGKNRIVRFGSLKHSYTRHDKEMEERKRRPMAKRKQLFKD